MADTLYARLMDGPGGGDPFDRHLFACTIGTVLSEGVASLSRGLGLSSESLAALIGRHFPDAPGLLAGLSVETHDDLPLSPEEPDLRALILDNRRGALVEEEWLAHILARRSLGTNHLWQDLGLTGRTDLSALMRRHFPALANLNNRDMKWKKFLYRELCQREGIIICKSPNCDICADYDICFGAEDGRPAADANPLS
ncbi:nitrogen fixation protein NifQ [Magnetospirillum molischianum]|uniref:NifQ protein n=1 Tax=Magnetospirillum molischianum DSM 120 TaxID=1150626 RepID=H8FPP1_MAGML|nr:nitrogen fixation protein NifQ [Magnetospirillum molischianum]CCG40329.1 NifQ protein [Magnetospirillum molischianum DSM 120]